VTRIENELQNRLQLLRAKRTAPVEDRMPQRPGFGTKGKIVLLWANYFELTDYGELMLHRYSIEVTELELRKCPTGKRLKRVIQLLIQDHLTQYGHHVVTDFKANLLSKTELDLKPEYIVTYLSEGEDDPSPNAKRYRILLQPTGTLTVSELMDYLSSTDISSQLFGSKEEILQALNIAVGHHPKQAADIATVGANKHFQLDAALRESFDLGAGLSAIRGFFVSVRAATARLLVNVQVKHGAFYNDGPLDRLMLAYISENGPNLVRLWNFIKRLSVDVTHILKRKKSGERVPRIKQLQGFAMPNDGQDQAYPPIVPSYGAGARKVKFFLNDSPVQQLQSQVTSSPSGNKGKGKQRGMGSTTDPSTSQGRYISVYDFFSQRMYTLLYTEG
jgi:eukaryotic translation initiation factor 2C